MTDRRRRPTVPTSGGRRYITVAVIGELVGVHPKTVRKWIIAGTLKASKFASEWRIAEDDYADFERRARFTPDTPPRPVPAR